MRKNLTKRALLQGEAVIGSWLEELRSPAVAQLLAAAGLNFLIVDMEHGPFNLETVADLVRMARQVDITPIVRIPDLSWERVGRVLDAGAQGLMLPRVREAAEVIKFIDALKYPPAGRRGMASGLGNTDFKSVMTQEYIDFINEEMLVIVQIETKEAVANLEALVNVPGIDVFFIGPEDLSIALGLTGQSDHPQMVETIQQVIATATQHHIFTGIHSSAVSAIPALLGQGIRFIAYASDVEFLYNGARQGVQALQEHQKHE